MTDEQAKQMIGLLKEIADLTKGMHKELREIKVRTTEMAK